MDFLSRDLNQLQDILANYDRVFVIADTNTRELCFPLLKSMLSEDFCITVPSGEIYKNLNTVQTVIGQLMEQGADRHSLLLALGGGMVTDLTGFVADIYMRGIDYIAIPTTLLGMVDASIGGKTGVNVNHHKNMAGTFSVPRSILIHHEFLLTLSDRNLRSGFAEMLKHGLVADADLWRQLTRVGYKALDNELITRAARLKKHITDQDPKELGMRKILNFGHTVGHALESYWLDRGENLLHGEAVALGMMMETRWSAAEAGLDKNCAEEIIHYLETIFEDVLDFQVNKDSLIPYMLMDKKNRNGQIHWIPLRSIGEAIY